MGLESIPKEGSKVKIQSYKHDGSIHRVWSETTILKGTDHVVIGGNNRIRDGKYHLLDEDEYVDVLQQWIERKKGPFAPDFIKVWQGRFNNDYKSY